MQAILARSLCWLICGFLLGSSGSSAQPRDRRSPVIRSVDPKRDARIRTDVNLTLLPVTVFDEATGQIVNGLRREQFTVVEDKTPQPIVTFSGEDALCSVGLLFDTSGSMNHKIDKARLALAHLFEVLNPQDEVFLMSFADHPELRRDFTTNFASLQDTFLFTSPTGRTALIDAVYLGLHRMRTARNPRRGLVVISDGGDNDSRYESRDLFEYAMEADVQIHALGVQPDRYGIFVLDGMANANGGLSITVDKLKELGDAMNTIGQALHHQYLIGYYSPPRLNGKKWRKVQVKVTPADGQQRLRAYTRSGYFGPE